MKVTGKAVQVKARAYMFTGCVKALRLRSKYVFTG
jgi:hypothetical protein